MASSRTASIDFLERQKEREQEAEDTRRALRAASRSAAKRAAAEYLADRSADAERRTRALADRVAELSTVLDRGLRRPVRVDLDALRRPVVLPPLDLSGVGWRAIPPDWAGYEPPGPTPLRRLLGGGARHQRALADARAAYERDRAEYDRVEADRQLRFTDARARHRTLVARERRRVAEHNRSVDEFAAALRDGDPDAVCRYLELALDAVPLPPSFPRGAAVGWAGHPVVRVPLPPPSVVPTVRAVRYDPTADELDELPRDPAEAAALYRLVVAEVALLCLHSAHAADPRLDAVSLTASVGATALVTVGTDRAAVRRADPRDPAAALDQLGALVSAHPYGLEPIVG